MYNLAVCCLSQLSVVLVVVDWAWKGFNRFKGSKMFPNTSLSVFVLSHLKVQLK